MTDPIDSVSHYNQLFHRGEFDFQSFSIEDLPKTTANFLQNFVLDYGWGAKLHQPVYHGVYVFQISHPIVKFLFHDPRCQGRHMWGDSKFKNLPNNQALAELIAVSGKKELEKLFDAFDSAIEKKDQS